MYKNLRICNGRPLTLLACFALTAALGCNACGSNQQEAEKPTPTVTATAPADATPPPDPSGQERASGGCAIGGCSSELCQEQGAAADQAFTNCEYKRHYDCYKDAKCGRDAQNQCNWEMTPLLEKCLERHGAL